MLRYGALQACSVARARWTIRITGQDKTCGSVAGLALASGFRSHCPG